MKPDSGDYCKCFGVLGNPLRIDIINALMRKPYSVTELAVFLGAEQSRISHSLETLGKCGFVERKREGKKIIYSVPWDFAKKVKERGIFAALQKHYESHFDSCWKAEE